MKNNTVIVYSTTTCPYCDMMKNFLKQQEIPFKDINIQKDQEAANKLVKATGRMGVPQTEVNGEWVLGFDPNKVIQLLN